MLPVFLVLSLLAFLDGSLASFSLPKWRPDLRIKGLHLGEDSPLRTREVLEGITTDAPSVTNSTIIPVALSSDRQ